jgi:hypothetical protein
MSVTALCLASACSDKSLCTNTIQAQSSAPGGLHHAVVFQRDCGATTGFSTQVSVLNGPGPTLDANLPTNPGNAFIADTDHGAAPAAAWGGPTVELSWQTAQRLVIRHHPSARLFTEPSTVSGVVVVYEKGASQTHGG